MNYRHIGKPTQRQDGLNIVTGKAIYANDVYLPNTLYGKYLKSPYPHANIVSIDVSEAKALPGVKAVLTYKDVDPTWLNGTPVHRKCLDRRLRFVGDAVAIVAATSEEIAEEALKLIRVEYEVLPAVFTSDEAFAEGAPQLYDQFPGNHMTKGCPNFEHGGPPFHALHLGDIKKGLEESDMVIKGQAFYNKLPATLAIEPPTMTVRWDDDDHVTAWASSQDSGMFEVRNQDRLGGVKVRCISQQVGGSFGNKGAMTAVLMWAAALSKATDRPVKFTLTKTEHLIDWEMRISTKIEANIGMMKDGYVRAFDGLMTVDTGIYSDNTQGQVSVALGEAQLIMGKCRNWNLETDLAVTNRVASGTNKGFGGQELKCALIPIIMKGVRSIDMDPVEYYKKNITMPGDEYMWRDGVYYVCKEVNYQEIIKKSAESFGWSEKWKGWLKPVKVEGSKATGIGVGVHMNADAGESRAEAYVRVGFGPRVTIHINQPESGMAQRLASVKMAAEVFDCPVEFCSVVPSDSHLNPGNIGLVGSRGTRTNGTAVSLAAMDAKRQLFELFSQKFDEPVETLHTKDGVIWSDSKPERKIPWLALLTPYGSVTGVGVFPRDDFSSPNFFINFVELEVDTETGLVEIKKLCGGTDVGQIIDPVVARMQMHGGIGSAGIDSGLYEGHILDRRFGKLLTSNLIDYKWRPFNDFMEFDDVFTESQWNIAPFKAIGFGEITGAAGPPAVLMAVSNAIGVELEDYPVTPDKVLKALGKA